MKPVYAGVRGQLYVAGETQRETAICTQPNAPGKMSRMEGNTPCGMGYSGRGGLKGGKEGRMISA